MRRESLGVKVAIIALFLALTGGEARLFLLLAEKIVCTHPMVA